MNQSKFEELMKNRAHQNVQTKLRRFRDTMKKAFKDLTGEDGICSNSNCKAREVNYSILKMALDEQDFHPSNKWPRWLWEDEEEKVTAEVLSTMDEMQKMLIAPEPKDTDCQPAD